MFAWSFQIISSLESQSKFQIFTLPCWCPTEEHQHGGLLTGLCKFVQNISTNIWSLGKRTDLKLGEMSYLFISYNIVISWLYTLNDFRIIFLLCDSTNQE